MNIINTIMPKYTSTFQGSPINFFESGIYASGTQNRPSSGNDIYLDLPFKPKFVICKNGTFFEANSGAPSYYVTTYFLYTESGEQKEFFVEWYQGSIVKHVTNITSSDSYGWNDTNKQLHIVLKTQNGASDIVYWEAIG